MTVVHVGLDVGGTASRWVACDAGGELVARGSAGGATAHVFNPAERSRLATVFEAVAAALREAGLRPASLCAGMTGFGAPAADEIRSMAETALALSAGAAMVMDDIVMAYAAHFRPGEGHLISAGTGSIGIHVTKAGEVIRVGGRGILIDDAGSGSWIALQALDRMYRALDHTGGFVEVEELARQMFLLVGGNSWSDVRQFVYAGDRGRIGTLAVGVARAAESGDQTALDILRRAGAELAALGEALHTRCGAGPIALVGGVLQLNPLIVDEITWRFPGVDLTTPVIDSPLGAARMRTSEAGRPWLALLANGLGTP
ncbi:BadF-type ATPase [Devosia lucknowensis]|uniref:BadF-type ATPase n=1 Tax=Devosia lucknowensis TaxID=1096929 RepID=A0A1Y6G542_9HYPH|nr:BadF/BadG/BcrA/BcrD ATPase family protein [Devosia lucknowensis]SMQ85341.1 BadF-type ATPase [Devosia lucknowensis]